MSRDKISATEAPKRKTRTSSAVKNRWNSAHYESFRFVLDKRTADAYRSKCERLGMSLSDIPKRAVFNFLAADRQK